MISNSLMQTICEAQGTDLDDRVVMGERVEVVVKHRLADDVQRQAAEEILHLHGPPRSRCILQRLPAMVKT